MPPTPSGFVVWLTGLPCSGKSTLSDLLEKKLRDHEYKVEKLDGDAVRKNLSSDLGFSKKDREENIRRVAAAAAVFSKNGEAVLVSLVSPYRQMRQNAREQIENFIEVHVRCPLKICEERDTKGMYALARLGKISAFTGVSDPYEEPTNPEVTVDTDKADVDFCAEEIMACLERSGFLKKTANKK